MSVEPLGGFLANPLNAKDNDDENRDNSDHIGFEAVISITDCKATNPSINSVVLRPAELNELKFTLRRSARIPNRHLIATKLLPQPD